MILLDNIKNRIKEEYNRFKETDMYGHKELKDRQDLDQFFTPYEATIKMLERYEGMDLSNNKILDPTCGSGNLLTACLLAGVSIENLYGNDFDKIMVDLCRERLVRVYLDYNLGDKTEEELKSIVNKNIHRGNALHKFCLNYFDNDYDELYFGRATSEEAQLKKLTSPSNDSGACSRLKKRSQEKYINSVATEEELKYYNKNNNIDMSAVNTKVEEAPKQSYIQEDIF